MGAVENKTNDPKLIQFAKALSATIGAKDGNTQSHSERVAKYSREIAKRHGLSEDEQDNIYMMGLLHDIGKIGIPEMVLNKWGRLIDDEEELLKSHTLIGERILKNIEDYPKLASVARSHHERYDGTGYPDGLAGENIPMEARIIAVAEVYDEMTGITIYESSPSQAEVMAEIEKGSGSLFDPVFAKIMLEMIDEGWDFDIPE